MILLNVSFGIFALLPQGWLFMLFVILIECIILTKFLKNKWFNKRIYGTATLANMVSGAAGMIISIALNGGWWLVVWFPWVSSNEVRTEAHIKWLFIYYACAFVLTIIIELLANWLFLKKYYKGKKILTATMLANIASYTVGTLVLYLYSFS